MRLYTRPQDQGQIVEVSYGYDSRGNAYRRTVDRSDRSESWECGKLDWDREPEGDAGQDHIPCMISWQPCEPPSDDDE